MTSARPRLLAVLGEHAYGDPGRGPGYEYSNFLPAWRGLGFEVQLFDNLARAPYRDFADLNRRFLETVERFDPDVVFCVLMHYELWRETLQLAQGGSRARFIHWATDDSWKYEQFSRFMAPVFDLYATTYPSALEKGRRDGLRNLVLSQWAAGAGTLARPVPARECRYAVSFVGAAYGNRPGWIGALRRRGVNVDCFGHGWPNGSVPYDGLLDIIRHSQVSLNFADSGIHLRGMRPYRSRQIKARVFEVPGAGGLLATEAAEGLEAYLTPGEEILVFREPDDLAEQIRGLLADPERRDRMAEAGHRRVCAQHTYAHRFRSLLQQVGPSAPQGPPADIDWQAFGTAEARHRLTPGLRVLAGLLAAPLRLVWGPRRGRRAARRLLFELSWRIAGARTYGAAGWPGRMFYRES